MKFFSFCSFIGPRQHGCQDVSYSVLETGGYRRYTHTRTHARTHVRTHARTHTHTHKLNFITKITINIFFTPVNLTNLLTHTAIL